jgi:hypothetical protein
MALSTLTATTDVSSSNLKLYAESLLQGITKSDVGQNETNYKERGTPSFSTKTEEATEMQSTLASGIVPSPLTPRGESIEQRFRGVVDQAEGSTSHVTLSYAGRDNAFLLPTKLLESAGASYAGALFEIVLKKEAGVHTYDIVHLIEEENRARAESPPLDLSFLDGIDVTRAPRRR